MKVILKQISGTPETNLERARHEMERVLTFRGSVTDVKAERTRIIVEVKINPKWDLPESEKFSSLKEWIPVKVRTIFKVISVSE